MPGRPWSRPPLRTSAATTSPERSCTTNDTPPSPTATRSPGSSRDSSSSSATPIRSAALTPSRSAGTRLTTAPVTRSAPPSGNGVVRIFGPGRSARIPRWGTVARSRRTRSTASAIEPCASGTLADIHPHSSHRPQRRRGVGRRPDRRHDLGATPAFGLAAARRHHLAHRHSMPARHHRRASSCTNEPCGPWLAAGASPTLVDGGQHRRGPAQGSRTFVASHSMHGTVGTAAPTVNGRRDLPAVGDVDDESGA